MTYRPTFLGCLFLLLALALTACEVLGVFEFVTEHPTSLYVAAGSCIIAAITPGLPALADWFARSRGRRYAAGAWLGFVICLAIVLLAAIQRTGTATDAAEQLRTKAGRAVQIAELAEKQAADDYRVAQAAAIKECDVRRTRCLEAEAKAEAARKVLAKARGDLVSAPAGEQVDPLARRLALVLPLAEPQIRLLQPLLVPFALSLLSVLFFAGWSRIDFTGHAPSPAETRPAVSNVIPMVPPTQPKSVPAAKFGAVSAFLVSRTEAAAGESIEIEGALYNAYVEWCRIGLVAPYNKDQFALALARLGEEAALMIEIRGKQAYCLNMRLAA